MIFLMKLPDVIFRNKWKIIAFIILLLIIIYLLLGNYGIHSDPVIRFLFSWINHYLLLIEKLSNFLLKLTGSDITIHNNMIVIYDEQLYGIDRGILIIKWAFLLLLIIWLTPTSIRRKILISGVVIITNVLFGIIDILIMAHFIVSGNDQESSQKIARTFGILIMISLYFIWIRQNKYQIFKKVEKFNLNTEMVGNKLNELAIVLFVFAIAANFIYGYLNFSLWTNQLILYIQKMLSALGYEAFIHINNLIGDYGTVNINKGCLGYDTMLKFAVIVYLTGLNNLRRWSFIIIGFVILNILNFLRLLLLFIHLQKHGDYELAVSFHNISKYVVYGIVFILWIIWFEFFTDIRPIIRRKTDIIESHKEKEICS